MLYLGCGVLTRTFGNWIRLSGVVRIAFAVSTKVIINSNGPAEGAWGKLVPSSYKERAYSYQRVYCSVMRQRGNPKI